jgi:hypothetical protein
VAVAGNAGCTTHSSKYCAKKIVLRQNCTSAEYLEQIRSEFDTINPRMFLPMSDKSLGIISEDDFLYSKAPIAPLKTLLMVQHKEELLAICKDISVETPLTKLVNESADILDWHTFPAVLKTARAGEVGRENKPAVQYFQTKSDLENFINSNRQLSPWLLQEQIVGPGKGVFVLAQNGEIISSFCHERLLDKPPTGGVSVLSKSIVQSESPIPEATRLIRALNWTGIAMVEFKISASTGKAYLMEINPRFWGTLQLSISCGVDFPWLLFLMHLGELESKRARQAIEQAKYYKTGKRLRWDLGTVDHLLIRLKKEGPAVIKDVLFKNALQLRFAPGTAHETFSFDDMFPFFAELRNYFIR